MSKLARFLAAIAVAGVAATSAEAADFSQPPAIGSKTVIPPEEVGSGWYLRGDIAYGIPVEPRMSFTDPGLTINSVHTDQSFGGTIGFGYKFNEWLRADLTGDWLGDRGIHWKRVGQCYGVTCPTSAGNKGTLSIIPVLANGYVDLGTWSSITPYIGGGIGVAWVTANQTAFTDTTAVNVVGGKSYTGSAITWGKQTTMSLAAAAMAGFAWDLGEGMSLDVGYRYLWVQEGKGGTATQTLGTGGTTTTIQGAGQLRYRDLGVQQFRVGLRFNLD